MLPVVDAGEVTMPGTTRLSKSTSVILRADYAHSFVMVPGMIAPSPDWIVQTNNRNLFDVSRGRFVRRMTGDLIAYDTGVDDGSELTPPCLRYRRTLLCWWRTRLTDLRDEMLAGTRLKRFEGMAALRWRNVFRRA